jgi:hypothetical protein
VNHNNKKKNYSNSSPQPKNYSRNYTNDSKASSKAHGKAPIEDPEHVPNGVCRHCKKEGQYMKDL